jgi:hypothetical protein
MPERHSRSKCITIQKTVHGYKHFFPLQFEFLDDVTEGQGETSKIFMKFNIYLLFQTKTSSFLSFEPEFCKSQAFLWPPPPYRLLEKLLLVRKAIIMLIHSDILSPLLIYLLMNWVNNLWGWYNHHRGTVAEAPKPLWRDPALCHP